MDIVLEVFDTFLLDRLYATVYPSTTPIIADRLLKDAATATSTFSSMRELPTPLQRTTQFFTLDPSPYAYLSAWPRDNIYRQALSLYFITWLAAVLPSLEAVRQQLTISGSSAS